MDAPSHEDPSPTGSSSDSRAVPSIPSILSSRDGSMMLSHGHPSLSLYHHNLARSFFSGHGRHHQGRQFSRRISGCNMGVLNSLQMNNTSPGDDVSSFKWAGGYNSETGYHAEGRGKAFRGSERIQTNALVVETSSATMRMTCGICFKLLTWKSPYGLENVLAFDGLSVAAILVCGHVYHAECLEQLTSEVDKRDPPCPLCSELSSVFGVP